MIKYVFKHGLSAYSNNKCRCSICREAVAKYASSPKRKKAALLYRNSKKFKDTRERYISRPEYKVKLKEYRSKPEYKRHQAEYRKERYDKGLSIAYYQKYISSQKYKSTRLAYKRKPLVILKTKCRELTRTELRGGRLTKFPCCVCGDSKVEAHHENYNNHLDVKWLCRKHHKILHQNKLIK